MSDPNSRLVYSTDSGFVAETNKPAASSASPFPQDGIVRLRRENKGRKGAGVITIHGVPGERQKELTTLLKKKCGTGGAIKEGIIDALRAAGATEESTVRMGEWEFDFVE